MTSPVVEVLLSTFNAGDYLQPLLASVQSQEGVQVRLNVRDDGSTDGTAEELQRIGKRAGIQVEAGNHLGAWRSYLALLAASPGDQNFTAFCDQDDVWLPGKLRAATDRLGKLDAPGLYCGRLIITDSQLRTLGRSSMPRRPMTLANALVENVALGPTVVLNEAGMRLVKAACAPRFIVMHDAWTYLILAALGEVVYDPEPRMLYRLHSGNALGLRLGPFARAGNFVKRRAVSYLHDQLVQAREFLRLFMSDLSPMNKTLVSRFCEPGDNWPARVARAYRPDVYRQASLDNLVLRGLLLSRAACPSAYRDRFDPVSSSGG